MTSLLSAAPLLLLLLVATVHDLRTREIPDWIPVAVLLAAVAGQLAEMLPTGWVGSLAGVLLGVCLTLPLFVMGGLGGGDVKLVAATGAWLGPIGLLAGLFWVAMCGLVLAVIAAWRGRRDLAYVPAIAGGLAIQCVWPAGVGFLIRLIGG